MKESVSPAARHPEFLVVTGAWEEGLYAHIKAAGDSMGSDQEVPSCVSGWPLWNQNPFIQAP